MGMVKIKIIRMQKAFKVNALSRYKRSRMYTLTTTHCHYNLIYYHLHTSMSMHTHISKKSNDHNNMNMIYRRLKQTDQHNRYYIIVMAVAGSQHKYHCTSLMFNVFKTTGRKTRWTAFCKAGLNADADVLHPEWRYERCHDKEGIVSLWWAKPVISFTSTRKQPTRCLIIYNAVMGMWCNCYTNTQQNIETLLAQPVLRHVMGIIENRTDQ